MELLKLLNAGEVIAQIVSFLLLLLLLRKFLWGRILKALDERKERIADEYQRIETGKADAAKARADYEEKIAAIDAEAQKRLRAAVEEGQGIIDAMRKTGHEQAQGIIDNAKASMQYEIVKAKEAIKEELVDITIKAAENIIEEKLTEDDDRRIVEDFLKRLDKIP